MNDYLFLMHDDAEDTDPTTRGSDWAGYLTMLRKSGHFSGGSAIGTGVCVAKSRPSKAVTAHLTGYIRVQAASMDEAKRLVEGNPVYEAGGTVEIRELPRAG